MNTELEKSITSLNFEEAIAELEEIIEKLESQESDLTLEEAVELYKRGILLSQHCNQILEKAQQEIKILTKNQNGELEEISFVEE
ncbi:MAG: exodeoxyribonuclease VII small subunit [Caldicoprobacterales bacterium]|jgi:exodeoxyribonuclease VII small subunit|nr:exodeoxyribonuclease VII small subunit [Clostridiales bacterium]